MIINKFSKNSDFWQVSLDGDDVLLSFNLPSGNYKSGYITRKVFEGLNKEGLIIDHYCYDGQWSFSNNLVIEDRGSSRVAVDFSIVRRGEDIVVDISYMLVEGNIISDTATVFFPAIDVKVKLSFVKILW